MLSIVLLLLSAISANHVFDLGAGKYFEKVCSPLHPTSLNGKSDFVCTLRSQDFHPDKILNTMKGLDILAQVEMVADLTKYLSSNLLKMKRNEASKFEEYRLSVGQQDLDSLVWFMIQIGWATNNYDYGFDLFEEFDHVDVLVLANRSTSEELIKRLAKTKPNLAAEIVHSFYPYQQVTMALNDHTGVVLEKVLDEYNPKKHSIAKHFTCQKVSDSNIENVLKLMKTASNFLTSNFQEEDSATLDILTKICYEKDSIEGFKVYKEAVKQYPGAKKVFDGAIMRSNNYKTTLLVLKESDLMPILDMFDQNQLEVVLQLLPASFENQKYDKVIENIILNGFESNDARAGDIVAKAIDNLKSNFSFKINKKQGGILNNSRVKSAIKANHDKLKITLGNVFIADQIKGDKLFALIEEFGGNAKFFKIFKGSNPEKVLLFLNQREDFDSAFKFFNLQAGGSLFEQDFFAENLSKAVNIFPEFHKVRGLGKKYSEIFLTIRRAQIAHLIFKFKAKSLSKLPKQFVQVLEKSQEL